MMAKLKALFERFRWVGWVVLAAVIAIATLVIRRMFAGPSEADRQRFTMPAVPTAVQQRVERAEERATVARIEASAQATAQRQQLEQIAKIPDGPDAGANRRKQLADLLRTIQ